MIIEDEPDAQILLKSYCEKSGSVHVKAIFDDAFVAQRYLQQNQTALLFVDIHLPGLDGLSMLSLLTYQPKVIFTTAYSEYSLKAFDYHVVDYLLKPIRFERFLKAISKLDELPSTVLPRTVTFNQASNEEFDPNRVKYIEAFGNYLKIHTMDKVVLLHVTMKEIALRLEPYGFVRLHKSYLVNPAFVHRVTDASCLLIGDVAVPIGISYRQQVKSRFR